MDITETILGNSRGRAITELRVEARTRRPRVISLAATLVSASVWACACACGRPEPQTWDRDIAVREVLTAVLDGLYVKPNTRVLVVDETLEPGTYYEKDEAPPPSRAADVVSLPNGTWVFRPRIERFRPPIEGIAAGTFEDWVAHSAPIPAPRSLTALRPIEWLSQAAWDALPLQTEPGLRVFQTRWMSFHSRFPGSSGRIHLSNVGFSPHRDEALLQVAESVSSMGGSGYWALLRREGACWVVVGRHGLWRA